MPGGKLCQDRGSRPVRVTVGRPNVWVHKSSQTHFLRQRQHADHDDCDSPDALKDARATLKLRQPVSECLTKRVAREDRHHGDDVWAFLSALFAALTAVFAKVGVENVNSDLATFIRTVVIIVVLGGILAARGLFQPVTTISPRTYLFLGLSGLATGVS